MIRAQVLADAVLRGRRFAAKPHCHFSPPPLRDRRSEPVRRSHRIAARAAPQQLHAAAPRRVRELELLTTRLERAAEQGDLAGYLVALNHGFSVQAGSGVTRTDLMRFVDQALRLWPGSPR
ncbi:hypothetical protein [Actinoplanes palleronii]|uniref:Uncharacterized protein n=1 Tax=Actinoplanes palleronii TaxID=113570 RepID=A0ABQ4BRS5_9ACTN|nr:hypothetical protein [Actinoplanes palleronii]GIE73369.1 hypothetical protein Apa02nite_094770 [Actinoplanes palleronii]